MILAVGEALMEFRREATDGRLTTPGTWAGPFPSGAPAIFASVAARLGAPTALAASVGDDAMGHALIGRMRLVSPMTVVDAAEQVAQGIIQTYQEPNRLLHEMIDYMRQGRMNVLVKFGDAARSDLASRA